MYSITCSREGVYYATHLWLVGDDDRLCWQTGDEVSNAASIQGVESSVDFVTEKEGVLRVTVQREGQRQR